MGALEGEIRLVGDRLFLREFVSDDCSAVQSYAGDAEVTRFTDWGPNSLDDTRSFLAATAAQSGMPDRREFDLAVVDTRTQDLVGGASLRVTDAEQREGEIGYVIHPAYWSLGYATEAAKLLLEFGFDQLGAAGNQRNLRPGKPCLGQGAEQSRSGIYWTGYQPHARPRGMARFATVHRHGLAMPWVWR